MASSFDIKPASSSARDRYLRVSLEHVRAANDIIISYDLERDGWLVESPVRAMWEDGDDSFDEWLEEVAFIPAWSEAADDQANIINGATGWEYVDCPVVDGVATLPDGTTVKSTAQVVRLPVLRG